MREAQAFWVVAPGRGEIIVQPLRPLRPGELLVRTSASAISRGSESLVSRGEVPEREWQRMRCPFQAGEFPGPVKYGYCAVGIVEEGPPETIGRRVFCLHPHQDRFIVPQEAVIDIPDDIPDRRAALAANMETAVNGLWDATPGPGDRIAVIGAGALSEGRSRSPTTGRRSRADRHPDHPPEYRNGAWLQVCRSAGGAARSRYRHSREWNA